MAKVEFGGGVVGITGSVGGWTFQENRSGNIVRTRPKGRIEPTEKQTTEQSIFVGLLQEFQALSAADKLLWDAFAVANPKTDRYGQSRSLTGQNWYTTINRARRTFSLPSAPTPPAHNLPVAITDFDLVVDPIAGLEIQNIVPDNPAGTGIMIFTTFPITGTQLQRSALRFTDLRAGGPFGSINLTAAWQTAHGISWPPSGFDDCYTVEAQIVPVKLTEGITGVGIDRVAEFT